MLVGLFSRSTLQMLTNIENRLEELFEQIEMMPPERVEMAEKVRWLKFSSMVTRIGAEKNRVLLRRSRIYDLVSRVYSEKKRECSSAGVKPSTFRLFVRMFYDLAIGDSKEQGHYRRLIKMNFAVVSVTTVVGLLGLSQKFSQEL